MQQSGRKLGAIAAILGTATSAAAHTSSEVLTRAQAEHAWTLEPGVVIPLALAATLFVAGAVRRRGRAGWSGAQVACFVAGWITLFIALVSPVHKLGALLFSVHMTQHELLMIIAAPLLVLSQPLLWFLWAIPMRWREATGQWIKRPRVAAIWAAMTAPLFVWLLHGSTLWAWHIPSLYDASVEYEWVHALQHTMFLGTALLFWWTLLHGRHGRLGYGMAVVYCFTTAVHTSILGALMTFAQQVWYRIYEGRTAAFGLSPIEDQQLGGLIMWVPAGVVFTVLGLWLLAAWINESERRVSYSKVEQLATNGGESA
jgi:putative membrane protein